MPEGTTQRRTTGPPQNRPVRPVRLSLNGFLHAGYELCTFMIAWALTYDHRVHCRALILQGGTDRDVPVRSAERIADAIRSDGNADVTVRIFPGVSHSLLPDADDLDSGWAMLPGFVTSPELIDVMSQWAVSKLVIKSNHGT